METCARCHKEVSCTIMSRFNTDIICIPCEKEERNHPQYQEASEAELNAVRRGDYNFPGIGKPLDL